MATPLNNHDRTCSQKVSFKSSDLPDTAATAPFMSGNDSIGKNLEVIKSIEDRDIKSLAPALIDKDGLLVKSKQKKK